MNRRSFLFGTPAVVLGSGLFRPAWTSPLVTQPIQRWMWNGIPTIFDQWGHKVPEEEGDAYMTAHLAKGFELYDWVVGRPPPKRLNANPSMWPVFNKRLR